MSAYIQLTLAEIAAIDVPVYGIIGGRWFEIEDVYEDGDDYFYGADVLEGDETPYERFPCFYSDETGSRVLCVVHSSGEYAVPTMAAYERQA